jgi:hypothetical protein
LPCGSLASVLSAFFAGVITHTLLLLIQCFVPGRYAKDEHEARDKLVAESFPILLDLWRHLLSSPVRRTIRICFSSACGSLMHERLAYA